MNNEELYLVWDFDMGLVCVGDKESAEKIYTQLVEENERYFEGEYLHDDEMGYKVIIGKLCKGHLIKMNDEKGEWEWHSKISESIKKTGNH